MNCEAGGEIENKGKTEVIEERLREWRKYLVSPRKDCTV